MKEWKRDEEEEMKKTLSLQIQTTYILLNVAVCSRV